MKSPRLIAAVLWVRAPWCTLCCVLLLSQAPAAMLCGTLPSIQLLHKYGLPQLYVDIVESLRYGDLPLYENTLADPNNADWLLRRGLWMVVQALRVVVQARFFWHVKKISEEVCTHLNLSSIDSTVICVLELKQACLRCFWPCVIGSRLSASASEAGRRYFGAAVWCGRRRTA